MDFLYCDAVEHAFDYLGGTPDEQAQRDCRRCVQQAYRALADARAWGYLVAQGRINTSAPYATGTISYTHTGGTSEREVVLAGGTWPTWAGPGCHLRVGDVTYAALERMSATRLTLTEALNPGADVAAGTSYTLYRDVYELPEDFVAQDTAIFEGNFGGLCYSDATSWLWEQRYTESSGTPRYYAITGDALFPGRLVLRLSPYPDAAKSVDFIYHRRPRVLTTEAYATGTATAAADSTTVTGSGTAWTAAMAGSVLRLGTATRPPTSPIGAYPAAVETRIVEVVGAAELRVEDAPAAAHAEVRYIISDPIDVQESMRNALLRGVEKHLHIARSIKDKPDAFQAYDFALREALAADSRSVQARAMGGASPRRMLKKDMPADFS